MWIVIWILLGATILVCGVCSAHAFDRLVAVERTQFEDAWLKDGKPYAGYFTGGLVWERSFRAGRASQRCSWKWASAPPDWIAKSPVTTGYQRRLKLFVRISLLAAALLAASFAVRFAIG
jgi:hypothetical protein